MRQQGRRRLRDGREVPVHDNDGLRKICRCPRRTWAKCEHAWHFAFCWEGKHYRFSLDRFTGKRVEGKDRVEPGQTIRLPPGVTMAPPAKPRASPTVSDRDAAEIRSLVIHKDDQVIVLNKPPGLAVQGGTGTERHVDGMLDALRFGFDERPRLVHRLDKDTSGLLLIARTGQAPGGWASPSAIARPKALLAVVVGVPPKPRAPSTCRSPWTRRHATAN
jgi:23S rRNA-/tRNA-specific pseudouridylate synthase